VLDAQIVQPCGTKSRQRHHLAPRDHTIQDKTTRSNPAETTIGGGIMAHAEMKTIAEDHDHPEIAMTAVDETEADPATDLIETGRETVIEIEIETEGKIGAMATLEEIEMAVGIAARTLKVLILFQEL
jgi:hypothetical protein